MAKQAHVILDFSMCMQGGINLCHARTCWVTKACTSKSQNMHMNNAQITITYHAGLHYVDDKCGLDICLINATLRARGRAERQWGIKLGNARPCCVIKACKSKWQKMHLDNAQLTNIYPAGLECVYGKCGLNNFVFKKYNKVQPHLTQHTITTQPPSIPHHTPT